MTPGSWWGPEKQVFHQSQRSSRKLAAGGGCPLQPPEGPECGAGLGGRLGRGAAARAVCSPAVATTEAPSKAVSWALYLLRADPSSTGLPHNKLHTRQSSPYPTLHLAGAPGDKDPHSHHRPGSPGQPVHTGATQCTPSALLYGGETEVSGEERDPKKGVIPSPLCSTPGGSTIV